jgi:WD40 repeat protein
VCVATNKKQTRVCWHPSGAYIFATSQDQKVYCWQVSSQKVVAQLRGHTGVVRDLDVSADGLCLISGSFDKTIRMWSVQEPCVA